MNWPLTAAALCLLARTAAACQLGNDAGLIDVEAGDWQGLRVGHAVAPGAAVEVLAAGSVLTSPWLVGTRSIELHWTPAASANDFTLVVEKQAQSDPAWTPLATLSAADVLAGSGTRIFTVNAPGPHQLRLRMAAWMAGELRVGPIRLQCLSEAERGELQFKERLDSFRDEMRTDVATLLASQQASNAVDTYAKARELLLADFGRVQEINARLKLIGAGASTSLGLVRTQALFDPLRYSEFQNFLNRLREDTERGDIVVGSAERGLTESIAEYGGLALRLFANDLVALVLEDVTQRALKRWGYRDEDGDAVDPKDMATNVEGFVRNLIDHRRAVENLDRELQELVTRANTRLLLLDTAVEGTLAHGLGFLRPAELLALRNQLLDPGIGVDVKLDAVRQKLDANPLVAQLRRGALDDEHTPLLTAMLGAVDELDEQVRLASIEERSIRAGIAGVIGRLAQQIEAMEDPLPPVFRKDALSWQARKEQALCPIRNAVALYSSQDDLLNTETLTRLDDGCN